MKHQILYIFTLTLTIFTTIPADCVADLVEISLKPLIDIPDSVEKDFAGFLFEPYYPIPSTIRTCGDWCPCSFDGAVEGCGCDLETICTGSIPVDLSSYNGIQFSWEASRDGSKYISISGKGRTRVEFQGKVNCDGFSGGEVEILGKDIQFSIDDDIPGVDKAAQKYEYDEDNSFVILGKCEEGCGECEIYTRLQFNPNTSGELNLNLKSLVFSGSYDSSQVIQGTHDYTWGTNGYCWMRDAKADRRERSLEEENTYKLLDITNGSGFRQQFSFAWTVIVCAGSIFALIV